MAGAWTWLSHLWTRLRGGAHTPAGGERRALPAPSELRSVRPVELVPLSQQGRAVRSTWSEAVAIRDGLEDCSWVYTCVTLIARTASSVPWIVEQRSGRSWRRVEGHPLELLLASPNPHWTGDALVERMVMHLLLSGNVIVSKIRDGVGVVGELWTLSPDKVKPVVGDDYLQSYEVTRAGGRRSREAPEDLIHGMLCNPGDPWWGLAPLKAASEAADGDVAASKWNYSLLKRSIAPSGILSFKQPLTKDQHDHARAQANARSGSDYVGEILVLGSDAEFRPFDRSRKDMDWVEGRKLSREEIALVFGVPLPLLSQDASTYNNLQLARRAFWRDNIRPLLLDLAGWWTQGLAPEFGADLRVVPDFSEVDELSRFTEDNLKAARDLWAMGVPFNRVDRLLRLGVGPIPGGEVGYIAANLVPASEGAVDPGGDPDAG